MSKPRERESLYTPLCRGLGVALNQGFLNAEAAEVVQTGLSPALEAELDVIITPDTVRYFTALTNLRNFNSLTNRFQKEAVPVFRALANPTILSWIRAGVSLSAPDADKTKKFFLSLETLRSIFESPGLLSFTSMVTFQELRRVLAHTTYASKPDPVVNLLIEHPEVVLLLARHGWANAPRKMPWSQRIQRFRKYQQSLGVPVVSEDELNQVLLQLLDPEITQQAQTPLEKQELLERVHNGTESSVKLAIRQHIVDHREPIQTEQEEQLDRHQLELIDFREHPYHPNAQLLPWTGYEIEAAHPSEIPYHFFFPLELIGIHMGAGGASRNRDAASDLEISPGPFRSPMAAEAALRIWTDSGWLDLYRGYLQTLHRNRDLTNSSLIHQLNDLQICAAYIFHPTRASSDNATDHALNRVQGELRPLRVGSKTSKLTKKSYSETKGFRVATQQDLIKGIWSDTYLTAAAAAFDTTTRSDAYYSTYQYRLSRIWKKLTSEFYSYLFSNGLITSDEDELPDRINDESFIELAEQLESLFPHCRDRLDKQRVQALLEPVTYDTGRGPFYFPNVVTFSRYLVDDSAEQAEGVVADAERTFIQILTTYRDLSWEDGKELRRFFFKLFPGYWDLPHFSKHPKSRLDGGKRQHLIMTDLAEFVATMVSPEIRRFLEQGER